jgi:hypothetical protein
MTEVIRWANSLDDRWLLAFFLLIIDVWALRLIWTSGAVRREKVKWTVVVLCCPIIGPLFWYVLGPKPRLGSSRTRT